MQGATRPSWRCSASDGGPPRKGEGRLEDDRNYTCIVGRGTVGETLDKCRGSTEIISGGLPARSSPDMRGTC